MRYKRPDPRKGWLGIDPRARVARGYDESATMHFADAHIHAGIETLKYMTFPGTSEDLFRVEGDPQEAAELARGLLIDTYSNFWEEPTITMELQKLVSYMVYYRTIYLYVQVSSGPERPVLLERIDDIAPETIVKRRRRGKKIYEQLVPRPETEFEVAGPRWFEFTDDEMVELTWPLREPQGERPPYQLALTVGLPEDRYSEQTLAASRAFAEPDEWFLPVTRGRLGAYAKALTAQRQTAFRTADALFHPPTEPVTQYFEIQRLLRTKIAAAELRAYILAKLNNEVIRRWADRNEWKRLELVFQPALLDAAEWRDVWEAYEKDEFSYEDVSDLLTEDREAPHAFDRN